MGMGPQRLVIMADTHVPKRAGDLPAELWVAIEAADVVIHAGDWVGVELLDELEARAQHLVGVHGNNDGTELRDRLPEVAHEVIAGVRFAVVHETGPAKGREERCAAWCSDDVLVFGHSHIPWDSTTPTGLRILNPGSPTDRRRQPFCTYLTATVFNGHLGSVLLRQLPPRTSTRRR